MRAVGALFASVLFFAWLFQSWGFATSEPFTRALTYSAATAILTFGGIERDLTTHGEAFRVVLRVVGPVLLVLIGISARARIKR